MYDGQSDVVTALPLAIRAEQPADAGSVEGVIERAFRNHPHSQQNEHRIVRALRAAEALVCPTVAVQSGAIVGYATFSRVQLNPEHDGWYGLGPVAVDPALQRRSIGSTLIGASLEALKAAGAAGCVVFGEARFYQRFGFETDSRLTFPGAPPGYFLAQSFCGPIPAAVVSYHPAFFISA